MVFYFFIKKFFLNFLEVKEKAVPLHPRLNAGGRAGSREGGRMCPGREAGGGGSDGRGERGGPRGCENFFCGKFGGTAERL